MRWPIKGPEIKQLKLKPKVINCKFVAMLCNIIMYLDLHASENSTNSTGKVRAVCDCTQSSEHLKCSLFWGDTFSVLCTSA